MILGKFLFFFIFFLKFNLVISLHLLNFRILTFVKFQFYLFNFRLCYIFKYFLYYNYLRLILMCENDNDEKTIKNILE